jgi:hypothetical protein
VARFALHHLLQDGDVVDELERREVAVKARLLRHVSEPAPYREAFVGLARIPSEEAMVTGVG